MTTPYNRVAGTSAKRIAGLSDAFFAIALTLIVLEIHVPRQAGVATEHDLMTEIASLTPRLLTYLLSFMTLGIFWVGQQTHLNNLRHSDRNLTWFHLAFLATIALMPFSTALLAEFMTFRTALLAYWLNILASGALSIAAVRYALRAGLVREGAGEEAFHALKRRLLIGQMLYAFGATLCLINTYWSIAFIVLVQLTFVLAPSSSRRALLTKPDPKADSRSSSPTRRTS
jgi:TMEM175 potassium channel family protein